MRPFLLLLACLPLITGCSKRLTPTELSTMARMNEGWQADMQAFAQVLAQASADFSSTERTLADTASTLGRAFLGDSTRRANHTREIAAYQRWFGIAQADVKRLDMRIVENREWFHRLEPGKSYLHAVRTQWDARRSVFYGEYQEAKAAVDAFKDVKSRWAIHTAPLAQATLPPNAPLQP